MVTPERTMSDSKLTGNARICMDIKKNHVMVMQTAFDLKTASWTELNEMKLLLVQLRGRNDFNDDIDDQQVTVRVIDGSTSSRERNKQIQILCEERRNKSSVSLELEKEEYDSG